MEKRPNDKLNEAKTKKENDKIDDVTNFTNELEEEFAAESEEIAQYDKGTASKDTTKLEDEDTQKY